ncbi:MAG: phosphoglycerate mutase (2,3-diphosphoglycerate-independent), partial [Bacteroidetes bacterium]
EQNYTQGTTDEFLKPLINASLQGAGNISADDVVICFNFRTDRCREITEVLTQQALPDYGMQPLPLHYITMTEYDATFKNVQVLFYNDNLTQTLGEVLAQHGKTQIRLAETEKYPHVTFFFSGGREQPFDGEKRLMAASPKVATYDLQPEMSAHQIVNLVVPELQNNSADFVCINFANADMVGHTGVFSAVVKAVETVDACVKQVTEAALASNYTVCITADHGNADFMINEDGSPNTQHSLNLVPFFVVAPDVQDYQLRDGKLGDIAPTILQLMGLEAPKEMTGKSLLAYE